MRLEILSHHVNWFGKHCVPVHCPCSRTDGHRIQNVGQQTPQRIQRERTTGPELTSLPRPALESPPSPFNLCQRQQGGTMLLEQRKDGPHTFRLLLIHQQPSAFRCHVVAQHRASAHPFPLPPCRRHLVPCPLADQFPFELRKREENVQRQPAERRAGVELLSD